MESSDEEKEKATTTAPPKKKKSVAQKVAEREELNRKAAEHEIQQLYHGWLRRSMEAQDCRKYK